MHGALARYTLRTGSDGTVNMVLEPGTYDIRVRSEATLMSVLRSVALAPGMDPVDAGVLVGGDVDGDDTVGVLDHAAMVACFGYAAGNPQAPAHVSRCDLDGDGHVTALDYSAMLMSFGQTGNLN